jgi:hypothetical protein
LTSGPQSLLTRLGESCSKIAAVTEIIYRYEYFFVSQLFSLAQQLVFLCREIFLNQIP